MRTLETAHPGGHDHHPSLASLACPDRGRDDYGLTSRLQTVAACLAFTLIELLISVSILLLLLGMLMPILGFANREARKSATRTVMVKVDTALRLFRADLGPYPFQLAYADLAGGEAWSNRLNYHLGTELADDDRDKIIKDANDAAALYGYSDKWGPAPNLHTYSNNSSRPRDTLEGWGAIYLANRMARERVRLAMYSGNISISDGVLKSPYITWRDMYNAPGGLHYVRRVLPTTPLLASPGSAAKPGWAKDYLKGEIPRRYVDGEAILDGWNRRLIYVCQVVEGMVSAPLICTTCEGFDMTIDFNVVDMGLHTVGRRTLIRAPFTDAITGAALSADATYLPDLSNLMHSDRRRYAPRGLEAEPELWSAGPDGLADWMRDATVNRDNVSLQAYDKNIP